MIDKGTGEPVPRATVRVVFVIDGGLQLRSVVASDSGTFAIPDVPPGRHVVSALRLGYAPAERPVEAVSHVTELLIKLERVAVPLTEVRVEATAVQRELQRNGFYDRAEYYTGVFWDRAAIARRNPRDLAAVIGPFMSACSALFINGSRIQSGTPITLAEVIGVEVYMSKAAAPVEFQSPYTSGGPGCRTIMVWTSALANVEH